jgi:hypothetical protein
MSTWSSGARTRSTKQNADHVKHYGSRARKCLTQATEGVIKELSISGLAYPVTCNGRDKDVEHKGFAFTQSNVPLSDVERFTKE